MIKVRTSLFLLSSALLLLGCGSEEGSDGEGSGGSADGGRGGAASGGSDGAGGSTSEDGDGGASGDGTGGADGTGGGTQEPVLDCDGVAPLVSGVDGVYFEVEAIEPVGGWTEETTVDGFLGDSYFHWPDESEGAPSDGDPVPRYCFAVETAGTYLLEMRVRRDRDGSCASAGNGDCNDVWIQVDGKGALHEGTQQIWTKKMAAGDWGEWAWNDKWDPENGAPHATEIELAAGAHEFAFSGRSQLVKVDAVRIWLDSSEKPAEPL